MSSETIYSIIFGMVVSIVLGCIFYYRAKQKVHLTYYQNSSTLIAKLNDDFYEDIEIKFRGHSINKLTSTVFRVWNSGNTAIVQNQIAPKGPLQIQSNNQILTARITKQSRAICGIIIENEKIDDLIRFNFDFLNPEDGFVCEVIHAGENNDIILSGEIMGATKKIQRLEIMDRKKTSEYYLGIITLFTAFSGALAGLLPWNWKKIMDISTDPVLVLINLLFLVTLAVSCSIISFRLYQIRKLKFPITLLD